MGFFQDLGAAISGAAQALAGAVQSCFQTSPVKGMPADEAKAAIAQAQEDAVEALDKRIKALDAWDADTEASFKTWFGTDDPAARDQVRERMVRTRDHLASLTPEAFAPDDDAYAYVYAHDDTRMYLGQGFADAPATGRDSKAGTLIHEASHYTSVAGTDDVVHNGRTVYGEAGAKTLARDDPAKALQNADSFEYFVEDGF